MANPFYSVWASEIGTKVAVSFRYLSCIIKRVILEEFTLNVGVFAFFLDWHHRLPSLLWQGSLSVCTLSPCVAWCFVCSGTSVGNYSSFLRCQRPEDCVTRFDLFVFTSESQVKREILGYKYFIQWMKQHPGCFSTLAGFQGIIFRFKFLMLVTLACAAMTVISFILNQVSISPLLIDMYILTTGFMIITFKLW